MLYTSGHAADTLCAGTPCLRGSRPVLTVASSRRFPIAGFFGSHEGSWAARFAAAVDRGVQPDETRGMMIDLLGQYKSGWTTVGQQWRSFLRFRKVTGNSGDVLSKATFLSFVRWREERHRQDQEANPGKPRKAGLSIASGLSSLLSAHVKFNGATAEAVGDAAAHGAETMAGLHKKWKSKTKKRAGGESLAFDAAVTDAAITGGLHSDAAAWLRTSALFVCLAVESGSRCDDLQKINVPATLRRLADGNDGQTLQHPDGSMFHADENYNPSECVWQACIGDDSKGVAGKHRGARAWKDMGLRQGGVGLALFAEWAERENAFARIDQDPDAEIFFPGKFYKRSSHDVPRGADSHGWATHYYFDTTKEMGSSKDVWMTDVFAPLLISSGLLDPVLMRTHSGARMAGASFHGARRATSGRGQNASGGNKLPLQRLLMHKNPETQDSYVVINDKARSGVLAPSAVNLAGGIKLAPPGGRLSESARAQSRADQFVRSAIQSVSFRAGIGIAAGPVGAQGTYARSPSGPCFVISHVKGFPCLVLNLVSRATEVVQPGQLSAWPPAAAGQETGSAPRGAGGASATSLTEDDAGAQFAGAHAAVVTPGEATAALTATEWHWVDDAWAVGTWVKHGFRAEGSQCDFFAPSNQFLGLVESIWHSPTEPVAHAWQRRVRFEDGDIADFSASELEEAVASAAVTRPSADADGTSMEARQGGALPWQATTTDTVWQSWPHASTEPHAMRQRSNIMKLALARSAELGQGAAGPPWIGTWRLRPFRRDESSAQAWAPCIVRAVLPQSRDVFIVCPFTRSSGLIKVGESSPWPSKASEAAQGDFWDVQKWREAGGWSHPVQDE